MVRAGARVATRIRLPRGRDRGLGRAPRGVTPLLLATLLSVGIIAGAAGATAAYWLLHQDRVEHVTAGSYLVELAPTAPGPYRVLLPVPMQNRAGDAVPGLALQVVEGAPQFGIVRTGHGAALSVVAEGPVKLRAEGDLPVQLTLDDVGFRFRQFSFWAYLDERAPGPVLMKVEVRERLHENDWELHVDNAKAIVVQEPLQPEGWQVLRATQLFEVQAWEGWGADFPHLALGAAIVGGASLYAPLGVLLLGAVRARRAVPPSGQVTPERPRGAA